MKALTVTASIVLSALVLCIAWLAFFPGDAGGPVVNVAVAPPPPEQQAPPPPSPQAAPAPSINLPPGFGISPVRPQSNPGGGAADQQQQAAKPPLPGDEGQPQPVGVQTVAVPPPVVPPPGLPPPPEEETASITLVDVPAEGLVEESEYGPLPKVATDGRRPIDVYARPSKYVTPPPDSPPRIAVLINGMGLSDAATAEVIKLLPAPVSVAYGAYGRNIQDWVEKARRDGHEVLLQVPLEPVDYPSNDPGPHTLLTTLPPEENLKRLQWLMSRFTGYVGITNLAGAKFENASEAMVPVFEELKSRGLLFVDDGTGRAVPPASPGSDAPSGPLGQTIAKTIGLDYAIADVQIDVVASPDDIAKALARLEALAKEKGAAIGVASAKPATAKQLAQWAGELKSRNIILVPVSAAVRSQRQS